VTLLDLAQGLVPRHVPLPRAVPVLRLPATGAAALPQIEAALTALDPDPGTAADAQAFVYLHLSADRPATALLADAEALLARYPVRLAGLSIARVQAAAHLPPPPSLADTSPEELFIAAYRDTHQLEPDSRHIAAFRDVFSEVEA